MRTVRPIALLLVAALALVALAACAPKQPDLPKPTEATPTAKPLTPAVIRLGNLPTEDILPLWAAQQRGLFDQAGVTIKIVPFQSAQERDAAFTAGAVDGFMGDIIAATELYDAGFKTRIVSVCLGATPAEGRFAIVSAPNSGIRTLKQLAGVPIGTSSNTIQEYVLDGLMTGAGVSQARVKKEEVKKVPIRFELLVNNELKAAALPEPFVSLALKQGAHLVAADTRGRNLSQTVLAFSQNYLAKPEGAEAVRRLLSIWDKGTQLVNANPSAYRNLLVEKARLPKPVASSYKINRYPKHQLPNEADVTAVLDWMRGNGLLPTPIAYADLVWTPGQTVEASRPSSLSTEPSGTTAPSSAPATP